MSSSSSPTEVESQSRTKTNFKEKLDRAAQEARSSKNGNKSQQPSLAEKVARYAPSIAKLLGIGNQGGRQSKPQPIPGPPERPQDDRPIEEFVRHQHKSKKGGGL